MQFTKVSPNKDQINIAISDLVPFGNHPFEWFTKGQRFEDMLEDMIQDKDGEYPHVIGVLQPIIVRPSTNGKYEILNGHYRVAAAKKLQLDTVPSLVLEKLTDNEALSYVSDVNPIGLWVKYGIDIYSVNYKESANYKNIENARVSFEDNFSMALDEYIERFLLTDYEIHDFYDSIYNLGDPSELNDEECKYEAVAREIIQRINPITNPQIGQWEKNKEPENIEKADDERSKEVDQIEDLVDTTIRQLKDYTRQLKKYLNIDLLAFDYANIKNKQEKAKIVYFIYMLRHNDEIFSKIDIWQLLSKPSMENIDNSFLGWETYNGKYIKRLKHSVEKEISLNLKNNIKNSVSHIVNEWGDYMQSITKDMECMAEAGHDISSYLDLFQSVIDAPFLPEINTKHLFVAPTPLEILYLRLVQHEYLGQIKDLLTLYDLQSDKGYYIPKEYIHDMKKFQAKHVCRNKFDEYFEVKNVQYIAKYVYLKAETDKEERRRIRECKNKVSKLLSFLSLAYPEANAMDNLTELLIISCLQAILLDKDEKVFDYTFNGFEGTNGNRKGEIHIQISLQSGRHVYDALKVYWIHRVKNHMYANIGNKELRKKIRNLEKLCVKILEKILSCPTVEKMLDMDSFYYYQLEK